MRRNHGSGPSNFTIGAVVLIAAVILTYLGFTKSIPFRHHYEIHAVFRTANNIKPNSFVRIAGAEGPTGPGKFDGIDVLKRVQDGAAPLPRSKARCIPVCNRWSCSRASGSACWRR